MIKKIFCFIDWTNKLKDDSYKLQVTSCRLQKNFAPCILSPAPYFCCLLKNAWRSIFVNGTLKNKVSNIVTINIDPNPLNTLVPIEKRTNAINPVLSWPSLIAGRLLSFAVSIDQLILLPSLSSSRSLSYIKIFASTHIQIDNIITAIPLSDNA